MGPTTMFVPSSGGGVRLVVAESEADVLDDLLGQLAELVAPEPSQDADPLAAMVGIGTATTTPTDPVLARLFPDAYVDDPDAAGEFRRYTENGLRDRKLAGAVLARATLADAVGGRDLTLDETMAWLGALNDLRLALGTRLGVTDDDHEPPEGLDPEDPSWVSHLVYHWLGGLQELLVHCLSGGPDVAD